MYCLKASTVSTELVLLTGANYGLSLDSAQASKIRGGYDARATAGAHPQPAATLPLHGFGTCHTWQRERTDPKRHQAPPTSLLR